MTNANPSILPHREFFAAITADFRAGTKVWRETSEEVYDAMLGAVPPVYMSGDAFALGEPYTSDANGHEVFAYFVARTGRYFGLYCTLQEIRAFFAIPGYRPFNRVARRVAA